jgi:hypothetical protein
LPDGEFIALRAIDAHVARACDRRAPNGGHGDIDRRLGLVAEIPSPALHADLQIAAVHPDLELVEHVRIAFGPHGMRVADPDDDIMGARQRDGVEAGQVVVSLSRLPGTARALLTPLSIRSHVAGRQNECGHQYQSCSHHRLLFSVLCF